MPPLSNTEAAREARVRRAMARCGLVLRKDRAWTINPDHLGGYMIIDTQYNAIVAGSRYDWTLEDCEEWLAEEE